MARPRFVTELQVWMIETGRDDTSLAAELSDKLKEDINARTVARWRKGYSSPRDTRHVLSLSELSGGRVTVDSLARANSPEEAALHRLTLQTAKNYLNRAIELGAGSAANNSGDVESGADRANSVVREVPPAIIGLADVAAALLVSSSSDEVTLEEMRRIFERLLDSRLAGRQ
jgi:hypothetical protein